MKYKKKFFVYFSAVFVLFLLYHFIIESKNQIISLENGNNLTKDAIDNTVNTSGYLWYNNTATIYTLLFVFLLGSTLLKLNNQNVIRIPRKTIGNNNLINSLICSFLYSALFCLPHLIFMYINFGRNVLSEINFFKIFALQFLSYILYYLLTSQIMTLIYYFTLNCIFSGILTFTINTVLMFAYKILHINTPIQFLLVCTKYYNSNMKDINIILDVLMFIPIISVFVILNKIKIKNRDVL